MFGVENLLISRVCENICRIYVLQSRTKITDARLGVFSVVYSFSVPR